MLRTETEKPLEGTLWKPNTPDTWNRNTNVLPLDSREPLEGTLRKYALPLISRTT